MELQKKLDDVDSDMRVDESRIGKIFHMADRWVRPGLVACLVSGAVRPHLKSHVKLPSHL